MVAADALTQALKTQHPVRAWFRQRLGNFDDIDLCVSGPRVATLPASINSQRDAWILGHAFDWRLQLGLGERRDFSMVLTGARRCGDADPAGTYTTSKMSDVPAGASVSLVDDEIQYRVWDDVLDHEQLVQDLVASLPKGRPTDMAGERHLARVATVLGLYESAGRQSQPPQMLVGLPQGASVDDVLATVPEAMVDDVVMLTGAARLGLKPLFPATRVECNPVVGTEWLQGDGDLLIDGVLVELKVTSPPKIKREWLWQLLGYVLLDDGRRRIDEVAVYLARYATLGRWGTDELFATLAGERVERRTLRTELEAAARRG